MEFLSISKQESSRTCPGLAFEPCSQVHDQYAIKIEQIWYNLSRTSIEQIINSMLPTDLFNLALILMKSSSQYTWDSIESKPKQNLLTCNNYYNQINQDKCLVNKTNQGMPIKSNQGI
jgi:hypothetical protein